MVDAVDRSFFAVGHHDVVAKDVDRFESKELAGGLIDDADARVADCACAQARARDEEDHIAVLRRETVMRGSSTEADVIRIGDAAGERD